MGILINQLTTAALRDALALLPRFPMEAAEKIVELRPFASLDDLLCKVNGAAALIQHRVSAKAAKHLKVVPLGDSPLAQADRARNADFGRELCGLQVDVPWSAPLQADPMPSASAIAAAADASAKVVSAAVAALSSPVAPDGPSPNRTRLPRLCLGASGVSDMVCPIGKT